MIRKAIIIVSALLILASVASAAPITTLKNTGVEATLAVDNNWLIDGSAAYVTTGWPLGAWKLNDSTSSWISPQPSYDGFLSDPGTAFVFSTSFEIPVGYAPSSAWFTMRLMADNHLMGVTLNGVALPITYFSGVLSHTAFNTWSDVYNNGNPFLVSSGFVSGLNTLSFLVENHPQTEPGNPTGIRVEFLDSDMDNAPIPEPASILLLGTGVLGAIRAARKRR